MTSFELGFERPFELGANAFERASCRTPPITPLQFEGVRRPL
jgi:hypothetical protein